MAVSFSYDGRIVVVRMVGDYTTAELRQVVLQSLDDPASPPKPMMLFDLRESTAIQKRSANEVKEMARFLASIGHRFAHRAALVASTDVAFGLMRLGSSLVADGGPTPGVFRDVEAARAWLLDPNAPPQL